MSLQYTETLSEITPQMLSSGFFVGWQNPPSPETHLKILENSQYVILAIDIDTKQIVGFINAISDYILSACIPLLEVLPEYQNQGIGSELVSRMLKKLNHLYMIDLVCDNELQSFYETRGMTNASDWQVGAMIIRNYDNQPGMCGL